MGTLTVNYKTRTDQYIKHQLFTSDVDVESLLFINLL